MKKNKLTNIISYFTLTLSYFLLSNCGTYRYYHPTTNPVLFRNKGEFHIAGDIGSSGASAKAAWAVSSSIGVMGFYNSSFLKYQAKQGEIGIGFHQANGSHGIFVVGGLGFGSNFEYKDSTHTTKIYEGTFYRPFVQLNTGITGGRMIGKMRGDLIFSLKGSYFIYNGRNLDASFTKIQSQYLILEPALVLGIGSSVVRFQLIYGLPFRPSFEKLSNNTNARTFPGNVSVGLQFIIGRKENAIPENHRNSGDQ